MHSAICKIYLVQWYSIDLWLIGGGYMCPEVYVAFCYMLKLFGVVVFHRSIVNWRRRSLGICVILL